MPYTTVREIKRLNPAQRLVEIVLDRAHKLRGVLIDIGNLGWRGAEENRKRIARGAPVWWTFLERTLQCTPRSRPLPSWVPIGNLPSAKFVKGEKNNESN